ncbi:MAG: ROK family protein, partial [Verrucomicrobiae bacterium]|nr:ROK family protein [Verrucomicrobiae bacterium]
RFPRAADDIAAFAGICPFHGDCLEGLASGPAMEARWGVKAETLPPDHPAWEIEAGHLAWACVNLACTLSPRRIVLGGGVMQHPALYPLIRARFLERLAGYLDVPEIVDRVDDYLVPAGLGQDAGLLGAVVLGQRGLGCHG